MRPIKFRCWDKKENKYFILSLEGMMAYYESDSNNYILQQFTGLYDKNGKEIYEGDILELGGFSDEQGLPQKFEVFYCEKLLAYQMKNKVEEEYLYYWVDDYPYEIIGNIYENPELMEKK